MLNWLKRLGGMTEAASRWVVGWSASALGTPPATMIELNLRIRNSAVTEFAFNPKRHHLVSFNTLPHLDTAETRVLITHA